MSKFSVRDAEAKLSRPGAPFKLGEERSGGWITFPNGWTVSIQWQGGNYCDNRGYPIGEYPAPDSPTAEIAIWKDTGDMVEWLDSRDTVVGWLTWDQVQQVLDRCEADEILQKLEPPKLVAVGGWEERA